MAILEIKTIQLYVVSFPHTSSTLTIEQIEISCKKTWVTMCFEGFWLLHTTENLEFAAFGFY
jgi:hypothetical protein